MFETNTNSNTKLRYYFFKYIQRAFELPSNFIRMYLALKGLAMKITVRNNSTLKWLFMFIDRYFVSY